MDKLIEDTNKLLRDTEQQRKAYAMHYLWGAIKANVEHGYISISYEELIKTLQEAIKES